MCLKINGTEVKIDDEHMQEVQAVMQNVEKVKGQAFAHAVKFLMNLEGFIGIFAAGTSIDDNVDTKSFKDAISQVGTILVGMYCDAVEIDQDEEMKEITRTANLLSDILKKAEKTAKRNAG